MLLIEVLMKWIMELSIRDNGQIMVSERGGGRKFGRMGVSILGTGKTTRPKVEED